MAVQTIKFMQWVGLMSFIQFHIFCGMLWDKQTGRFTKWDFWPGVRGYPGQKEVAESIQTSKITWLMKARQLGMSELAAFYAIYVAITEPKSEVIIISKKLPDSKYFLKRRVLYKLMSAYALEMEPGKKFPWPEYMDNTDTGKIVFSNGSWIEAASSDNEEVRSRSPRLVIFDEIRSFSKENAEELWSAILPAIESDPKAQVIGISTAKFGTWYNDMTEKIMDGKIDGINFMFLPDDTHPQRNAEWRKREAKKWSNATLFLREHPMNPEDCFISREGAVWPQFDPHVGGRHVNPAQINFGLRYIVAYDHGRTHPAVFLFMLHDKYNDHLYVFDEVFCRGMELPDVCYAIREKMLFYEKYHSAPKPQIKIADTACFNKDGRQTVSDIMRNLLGISFKKSIKYDMDGSLDMVSTRISYNQLTIDPRCVNTIRQVEDLTWKYEAGESKKEKPVDVEDDAPDLLRYVCAELRGVVKKPEKKVDLHFNREFNEHKEQLRRKIFGGQEGEAILTEEEGSSWQVG